MSKSKTSKMMPVKHIVANGMTLNLGDIMAIEDAEQQKAAVVNYLKVKISDVGVTLFNDIHNFAIFAMEHAKLHGDFHYMSVLVDAVRVCKGARHFSLIQWFERYSPASYAETRFIKGKGKDDSFWNVDAARAKPYYEKPEAVKKEYTLETLLTILEGVVKKADSDSANLMQKRDMQEIASLVSKLVLPVTKQKVAAIQAVDGIGEITEQEVIAA